MKCSVCNHTKDDYEFFRYINKYDRTFFAAGIPTKSDVCFDCGGDYRCIKCGVVQPSTEFRVQGRICYTCQGLNPTRRIAVHASNSGFDAIQVTEAINDDLEPFMGVLE